MGPPLSGEVQDDSLARISPHNNFCTTAAKRNSDFFLHLVRHTQQDSPKSLQYPTSGANNGGFVGEGGRGGGKDSDCTGLRGKVCVCVHTCGVCLWGVRSVSLQTRSMGTRRTRSLGYEVLKVAEGRKRGEARGMQMSDVTLL